MAFALLANPNKHFYEIRKKPVTLIVLHVTAGLQDLDMKGADHSAEATNRYGANTDRAASWHSCVDSDSIAPALPDEYTAFHCKNYNSGSLGIEICNKDAHWDNKPKPWTEATLLNAAKVCHAWEKKFKIPRRLLNKAAVDTGEKGYSYHMFLDPTRRSDPGKTFPWARFVEILNSLDIPNKTPQPRPTVAVPPFPLPIGWYFGDKDGPKESVSGYHSFNKELKLWQTQMEKNGWSFAPSKVDGYWDDQVKRVVGTLQKRLDLKVDGRLGPETWRAAWSARAKL